MRKERRRLASLRADQAPKVSQSQVARRAGMGLYRYWQIENGDGSDPSDDEKRAVAAALGVKVSDVLWPDAKAVAS